MKHLKMRDIITVTQCGGMIGQYTYMGWSIVGSWMKGVPTPTTKKFSVLGGITVDDIHPNNITHINNTEVAALDYVHTAKETKNANP